VIQRLIFLSSIEYLELQFHITHPGVCNIVTVLHST